MVFDEGVAVFRGHFDHRASGGSGEERQVGADFDSGHQGEGHFRRRILEAQTHFRLPSPALVEKDVHVVAAIRALAAIDAAPFSLVFGGGTSLARAHKLIRRTSENIDFKIVLWPGNEGLKSSALKRGLSALKHSVSAALASAGFQFDEKSESYVQARNQNQYHLTLSMAKASHDLNGHMRKEQFFCFADARAARRQLNQDGEAGAL